MVERSGNRTVTAALALWLAACAGDSGDVAGAAAVPAGAGTQATAGTSGDDGFFNPDGMAVETGAPPRTGSEGCTAVDILFVIDNSASMCASQMDLAQAFPRFADAMFDALPVGTDVHVGITTSSFCPMGGGSHGESNCVMNEDGATMLASYLKPQDGLAMGNGWQGRLLDHQGKRYFEANTADASARQPLKDWFAGAAVGVGCGGCSFEFNAAAGAYAFHGSNAEHNAGFLRDAGSVLVLFILSDEADQSPEDMGYYHDLVASKKAACGGNECIVTGGMLNVSCIDRGLNASYDFLASFGEEPVYGELSPFSGLGLPGLPGGDPMEGSTADEFERVVGQSLAQVVGDRCAQIRPPD